MRVGFEGGYDLGEDTDTLRFMCVDVNVEGNAGGTYGMFWRYTGVSAGCLNFDDGIHVSFLGRGRDSEDHIVAEGLAETACINGNKIVEWYFKNGILTAFIE